jgi:hypothetical protein
MNLTAHSFLSLLQRTLGSWPLIQGEAKNRERGETGSELNLTEAKASRPVVRVTGGTEGRNGEASERE